MTHWLPSLALAFGPSALLAVLSFRADRKRTGDAWMDYVNIATLILWLSPGLVILGGTLLPLPVGANPALAGAFCIVALAVFATVMYTAALARVNRKASDDQPRGDVGIFFYSYFGPVFGISALILYSVFVDHSLWSLSTDVIGYVYITIAGGLGLITAFRLGKSIQKSLRLQRMEYKQLAPCELNSRVREIAGAKNIQVKDVKVLRNLPMGSVNAFAYSGSSVFLSEALVDGLNREEVDSVIAHEVGHLADHLCWEPGRALRFGALVVWLAAMALAERAIAALPESFQFLQTIKWLSLFAVPPMARMWYSRRRERIAESNVTSLDNPRASISANYKLAVLNDIPLTRPAWSRLLMTHPTQHERNLMIARSSGLSETDVREIYRRADQEIRHHSGERYEVLLHGETERKTTLKRPSRVRGFLFRLVMTLVGIAFLSAGIIAGGLAKDITGNWLLFLAPFVLGLILFLLMFQVVPGRLARKRYRRFRKEAEQVLNERYQDEETVGMLLVDAVFMGDWTERVWQSALLGVKNGRILVLGERRRAEIDPSNLSIKRASDGATFGAAANVLKFRYSIDSVEHQTVVRNLGTPEKGLPSNTKQIQRWIEAQLAEAGSPILRKRRGLRETAVIAAKGLAALLITAAAVGLVELLIRTADLHQFDGLAQVITGVVVASAAFSLLFRKA